MSTFIDVHRHLLPRIYIDTVGTGPIVDQPPAAPPWHSAGQSRGRSTK